MGKNFVGYIRVSTEKQENGPEAQKRMIEDYANRVGGSVKKYFEDHISGKIDDRKNLNLAFSECERTGATLIVAKIDRLSRRVAFLFNLVDQLKKRGIEIIIAENPQAFGSTLQLGMYAVFAQHERETISKRTKDALAVVKRQGKQIGRKKGYSHKAETKEKISQAKRAYGRNYNQVGINLARKLRASGLTYREIAGELNDLDIKTPKGCTFSAKSVHRMLKQSSPIIENAKE